jgi:ubiquinone/menaquinone biosynthesis C-methylase UbiE
MLKQVYEQVSKSSDDAANAFLNYGFAAVEAPYNTLDLPEIQPDERTGMQLYHHVASAVDLKGLDVLEVGCGRGGGTSFIFDQLEPARMVGVDLAERAVANANRAYGRPGLTYEVGDAENLQFDDQSFDVVLNVESSHCYPNMDRFLAEVFRVLRPGGHLLMADLRQVEEVADLQTYLSESGLDVVVEEDITANVVTALEQESDRRIALIEGSSPKAMWPQMKDFAGVVGTSGFEQFANRDRLYLRFVARRPAQAPSALVADRSELASTAPPEPVAATGTESAPQPPTEPSLPDSAAQPASQASPDAEVSDSSAAAGATPAAPSAAAPARLTSPGSAAPRRNRGVLPSRRSSKARRAATTRSSARPTRSLPIAERRGRRGRQAPIARRRPSSGGNSW